MPTPLSCDTQASPELTLEEKQLRELHKREKSRYCQTLRKKSKKKKGNKSVTKFTFYSPHTSCAGVLKRHFSVENTGYLFERLPLKGDPSNSSTKGSLGRISGTFSTPRCRVTWSFPGVRVCEDPWLQLSGTHLWDPLTRSP